MAAGDLSGNVGRLGFITEGFTALKGAIPVQELDELQRAAALAENQITSLSGATDDLNRAVQSVSLSTRTLGKADTVALIAAFKQQTYTVSGATQAMGTYLSVLGKQFPTAYREVNAGVMQFIKLHKDLGNTVLTAKFNLDVYRLALKDGNLEMLAFQRALLSAKAPVDNLATSFDKFRAAFSNLKLAAAGGGAISKGFLDVTSASMREISGNRFMSGAMEVAAYGGGLSYLGGKAMPMLRSVGSNLGPLAPSLTTGGGLGRKLLTRGAVGALGAGISAGGFAEAGEGNLGTGLIGGVAGGAGAGAMIGGPWGAAVGAVTGGLMSLGTYFFAGGRAAKAFSKEVEEATRGTGMAKALLQDHAGSPARTKEDIQKEIEEARGRAGKLKGRSAFYIGSAKRAREGGDSESAGALYKMGLGAGEAALQEEEKIPKLQEELKTAAERRTILIEQELQIADLMHAPAQARVAKQRELYDIYKTQADNFTKEADRVGRSTVAGQEWMQKANESTMKALGSVNYIRRSMLEGMTASAMGISAGASATMPRNLNYAQLFKGGNVEGSLQTRNGMIDPTTGKSVGQNTQTYGQTLSMFGLKPTQGQDLAQQFVKALQDSGLTDTIKDILNSSRSVEQQGKFGN